MILCGKNILVGFVRNIITFFDGTGSWYGFDGSTTYF